MQSKSKENTERERKSRILKLKDIDSNHRKTRQKEKYLFMIYLKGVWTIRGA